MTEPNRDSSEGSESPTLQERSFWDTAEGISRTLSIAAIPFVLAVGGWIIQKRLQDQTVKRDYVQLAVTVLKEPASSKDMKKWAVDLLNDNSPTRFTPDIEKSLSDGTIQLPTNFNLTPTTAVPAVTSSANSKDEAVNWELKGFDFLVHRDAESALQAFANAEKLWPDYHSVREIRKLLEEKRTELVPAPKEGRSDAWKNFYHTLLANYSWGMTPDIKSKITEQLNNS